MKTLERNRLEATTSSRKSASHITAWIGLAMVCVFHTGCTALTSPISGIPAHRLPAQFHAPPKNNLIPINVSRLVQEPPRNYLVDAEDILGIYIEGVLGNPEEPPPVHMPQPGSDLPPAIGFPIPVREDGTLALPLVPALRVRGLTLTQIENVIRRAYTIDAQILPPGKDRIIVTIIRKRTYNVIVLRQDGERQSTISGADVTIQHATRGEIVQLEAYQNDVMHALAKTGGQPGLNAKNEIFILRANMMDAQKRDQFVREFYAQPVEPCMCRPPLPPDPAIVRIPLRLPPGETPRFTSNDIILEEGDIVLIEGREREVFYTGGLLGGGEHPLPRDYDLDVLGAIAIVRGINVTGQTQGGGGFGGVGAGNIGGIAPTQLFVLRKTPCNGQITIAVDLARAINDPLARPLVQAGDMLILQYKPEEEVLNFGLGTFFTYGIFQLLQND